MLIQCQKLLSYINLCDLRKFPLGLGRKHHGVDAAAGADGELLPLSGAVLPGLPERHRAAPSRPSLAMVGKRYLAGLMRGFHVCPFLCSNRCPNIHCLPAQAEERPDLISIYGDIPDWDMSMVTDMSRLFAYTSFNEPIGSWNTSAVTDMQDIKRERLPANYFL